MNGAPGRLTDVSTEQGGVGEFAPRRGVRVLTTSERAAERPEVGEYRIGREDVLEVVVWHEPELTRVVPVRPDGRISLPLAGEVEAAGKTPEELQAGSRARSSRSSTTRAWRCSSARSTPRGSSCTAR